LLGEDVATQSAPNLNTKTMLCVVRIYTNLLQLFFVKNSTLNMTFYYSHRQFFISGICSHIPWNT
jgi:hypothetical protein